MISHNRMRILALAPAFALFTLAGVPVGAQQAAPEIPFESVADPLKLPPDMNFGEATGVAVNSKGHVFVFSRGNTSGPAYAASAAQLLEFDRNGNSSARSARIYTLGRLPIRCASTRTTISGRSTRART